MKYHLFLFTILIAASCASSFSSKDRWEGLRENRLRVYVRFNFPVNHERDEYENNAPQFLRTMADERATMILAIDASLKKNISLTPEEVAAMIKNGKTVYQLCNDDYCESFTDYLFIKKNNER